MSMKKKKKTLKKWLTEQKQSKKSYIIGYIIKAVI